jgi:hypothetical protein
VIARRVLAVAVMALIAIPVSAPAQDVSRRSETGTRFTKKAYDNVRDARDTLSFFGRCVATQKPAVIARFLRDPVDANWQPVIDFPNGQSSCVQQWGMATSYREMRGAIAEGWYLHEFPAAAPAALVDGAAEAPAQAETVARLQAADEADRPMVLVDEFARCVATVAPRGTDAVLRTRVGSKEERSAINQLAPNFAPCAFEGQQYTFDEASLRAALAFALARQVATPEVGA